MTEMIAAVILAAGKGTRMNSDVPKVLHKVAGRAMIGHVLAAVRELEIDRRIVVVSPGDDAVASVVTPAETVVQERPLGTGDALRSALGALDGFSGTVLVLFGDSPLITGATLRRMIRAMDADPAPSGVVLGFSRDDPGNYGRLVTDTDGGLLKIVEAGEAVAMPNPARLCNGGVMVLSGTGLAARVAQLGNDNARKEFFLTELVEIARREGGHFAIVETEESETMGVDSRAALALAEAAMQRRLRTRHMNAGVTLVAPETVFLSHDTVIGRDSIIEPNVIFGPGVTVGSGVSIRGFSHLEGACIEDDAVIGPYARLRPGTRIGGRGADRQFCRGQAGDDRPRGPCQSPVLHRKRPGRRRNQYRCGDHNLQL